jgi:hypothetical protein
MGHTASQNMSLKDSLNLLNSNIASISTYPASYLKVDWDIFNYNTIPFYQYIVSQLEAPFRTIVANLFFGLYNGSKGIMD